MIVQIQLDLFTDDWGESNFNPMVRAWGLKKDRKAKCKSCVYFTAGQCYFRCPYDHAADFSACLRYESKRNQRRKPNGTIRI